MSGRCLIIIVDVWTSTTTTQGNDLQSVYNIVADMVDVLTKSISYEKESIFSLEQLVV